MDTLSATIVLIEWDGRKPPTTWYNRLSKLGLKVRGNKDESPLTRREAVESVIMQEGAVICKSESTARALGNIARELGAGSVLIASADFTGLDITDSDIRVLSRISDNYGKRGRKSNPVDWVVTCRDEMNSYNVNTSSPVYCPHCSSFNITFRPGTVNQYQPNGGTLYENWAGSRFNTGSFEAATIESDSNLPAVPAVPADASAPQFPPAFLDFASRVPGGMQAGLKVLDLGYRLLTMEPAQRLENHMRAIGFYFQAGGKVESVTLEAGEIAPVDLIGIAREYTGLIVSVNNH